jgi:hypothetical protein
MSDALQALFDSGALYLALGAVLCIVLGVGAARRLFQGAKEIEHSDEKIGPRRRSRISSSRITVAGTDSG